MADTTQHKWYSPADCSALLLGMRHGNHYRAPCPAHEGSNPESLSIQEGKDRYGNPMTLLHCFAHECSIEAICAAMGISVRNLFCIHPDYAKATRHVPRAQSPRIARLKVMEEPSPDDIAQILLEEMIVSDPVWIHECEPARKKMWELVQASPKSKEMLTKALHHARLRPTQFWNDLAREMER